MPRLLFEKTQNAAWISHLDLMRLFQRAFKRAGLHLTHSQGFNPRPSVSIALPLSVGVESVCELLDFELDGESLSCEEIQNRLNRALVDGIKVLCVYDKGSKIRDLTRLRCAVYLEYDNGVPDSALQSITSLFARQEILVEKKSKGKTQVQNIIPMIYGMDVTQLDCNTVVLDAVISCQNPTLNPTQLVSAIVNELPILKPDFFKCRRMEIFNDNNVVFR